MIPRVQKALDEQVQAFGHIFCEDHVFAVRPVEQLAQKLAGLEHLFLGVIGGLVAAPVDVAAPVGHVIEHRPGHLRRLGKAGGGIVQINARHGRVLPLFRCMICFQHTTGIAAVQLIY